MHFEEVWELVVMPINSSRSFLTLSMICASRVSLELVRHLIKQGRYHETDGVAYRVRDVPTGCNFLDLDTV
jgi:hypothetical protein